jgi:4-amino-4-deoxy-L-arabinose transferase-like glycosyltransferase
MRSRSDAIPAAAAALLVAVVLISIVSISGRQSQTFDEPTHVATGLEWLQNHRYTIWTETPPLARVAVAMWPYFDRVRLDERRDGAVNIGNAALYRDGAHARHLAEARFGTLPFFAVLLVVVWAWGRRSGSPATAFMAVAMVATLPSVVAHSALATTDIVFTAAFVAVTYALVRWLERPAWREAASLGIALGLAIATKFSTLIFFPPVALAIGLVRFLGERHVRTAPADRRFTLSQLGTIIGGIAIVVWAAYGFSIGTIAELPPVHGSRVSAEDGPLFAIVNRLEHARLPAPEFAHGLLDLMGHNQRGQRAYALGRISETGFWFFYPLALAVKTPLSFFLFALLGAAAVPAARRRDVDWSSVAALAAAAAVLIGVLTSRVNLGLRHVLVIYPLLSIAASMGAAVLLRHRLAMVRSGMTLLLIGVLAAQIVTLWRAHPDELAYFNPLAGSTPAALLADSDLDWGQDLYRLEALTQTLHIERLHIAYFGTARLCEPSLPPLTWLPPGRPQSGWIAISENYMRGAWNAGRRDVCDVAGGWSVPAPGENYSWLTAYTPVTMAGKSIRLYRIPSLTEHGRP